MQLAATVFTLALLTAALNWLVDPYRVFGAPNLGGINTIKIRPDHAIAEIKAVSMLRMRPDLLILGNSRAEIGFDPESPYLKGSGHVAFNAAIPGSALPVSRQMYSWLASQSAPATVVLGVDFQDFLTREAHIRAPGDVGAFDSLTRARLLVSSLLSVSTTSDSLRTLAQQKREHPETMTASGFNPLLEYQDIARNEGYYAMFRQRAEDGAKYYVKWPKSVYAANSSTSSDWELLRSLLQRMVADGAKVKLVIYPYHAELLAMYRELGLWPSFQEWKRHLTVLAHSQSELSKASIEVWDFSGFGTYQCEKVPPRGDTRQQVRWYWEGGHFKQALGDLMLERMFANEPSGEADFGVSLSANNLQANEARIQRELDNCQRDNPEAFNEATQVISLARNR